MIELAIADDPLAPASAARNLLAMLPSARTTLELERGTCTYSDTARDFVAQCLCKIPERRPTYARLLEHPFLTHAPTVDMATWAAQALASRRSVDEDVSVS